MSSAAGMRPDLWLARVTLRALAPLSEGLTLCFAEGLTSGRMLEYVYEDRPRGRTAIGRWVDARFIRSPGWRAVRERRAALERAMERAIAARREAGRDTELLDIASGPGGYVLSVMARLGEDGLHARCRDLDERWLERGRERATALGLRNVRFERGDALDRDGVLALRPRPDLAIASGFYDWITDDAMVRHSIAIVAEALTPGGAFVLTHQVANPDLRFINAVFTDFHHAPLTMKMRDVATVHGWLAGCGLVVDDVQHDHRRCYAVTLAHKP